MLEMTHPWCHLLLGVWEQAETTWFDEICSSPILCDAAEVSEFFSGAFPVRCQTSRGCLQKTHPLGSLWVHINPALVPLQDCAENKPGLSLSAVGFNAAAKVLLVILLRWDEAENLSWNDFAEGHLFIKISRYMVYSCYSSWTLLPWEQKALAGKKDESGNVWKKAVWKSVLHILWWYGKAFWACSTTERNFILNINNDFLASLPFSD